MKSKGILLILLFFITLGLGTYGLIISNSRSNLEVSSIYIVYKKIKNHRFNSMIFLISYLYFQNLF